MLGDLRIVYSVVVRLCVDINLIVTFKGFTLEKEVLSRFWLYLSCIYFLSSQPSNHRNTTIEILAILELYLFFEGYQEKHFTRLIICN